MAWLVTVMIVILILQVPSFLKNKMYRELWVFSLFWVIAFVYAGLVVSRVPLPTVVETLDFLYSWF